MSRVKSNFNGDIRRFDLPASPKFADLVAQLTSLYSLSDFRIKYKDDEGDLVTLTTDVELEEALASAPNNLLRIDILRSDIPSVPQPPAVPQVPATAPPPPPASEPRATPPQAAPGPPAAQNLGNNTPNIDGSPEQIMEGLAQFFESLLTPMAEAFQSSRMGARSRSWRNWQNWRQGASDSRNTGPGSSSVSPETTQALKALIREIMNTSGVPALMYSVPAAVPAVRAFFSSGLGQVGPVPPHAIDAFVSALTPAIVPHIGEVNAGRVAVFVRQALADAGVIALLRKLANFSTRVGTMAESASAYANATAESAGAAARTAANAAADAARTRMGTVARFDVHNGIICGGCNRMPIVGTRHWCTTRPDFNLCDSCIADPNVDKTGLEFRAIPFPWLADNSERKVPRPTLTFGSRGVEVRFLQKILTDLGFMTPDMYRLAVGLYGPNTAMAVNRFREQYGLGTQVYGVYDDIVAASLMSVLESNVPPVAAAGAGASSSSASAAGTGSTTAA